jgi:hypothetical protein
MNGGQGARAGTAAPTQKSRKGMEIPVSKHRDLMDAFCKIVQPVKKP